MWGRREGCSALGGHRLRAAGTSPAAPSSSVLSRAPPARGSERWGILRTRAEGAGMKSFHSSCFSSPRSLRSGLRG